MCCSCSPGVWGLCLEWVTLVAWAGRELGARLVSGMELSGMVLGIVPSCPEPVVWEEDMRPPLNPGCFSGCSSLTSAMAGEVYLPHRWSRRLMKGRNEEGRVGLPFPILN